MKVGAWMEGKVRERVEGDSNRGRREGGGDGMKRERRGGTKEGRDWESLSSDSLSLRGIVCFLFALQSRGMAWPSRPVR